MSPFEVGNRRDVEWETLLRQAAVTESLGYAYEPGVRVLVRASAPSWHDLLRNKLVRLGELASTGSDRERREFLISPIVQEIVAQEGLPLRVWEAIGVDGGVSGVNYLLLGRQQLILIAAENADMERGFTQLAAEMVALDQSPDGAGEQIYGAVSIGTLWQFCLLHRAEKRLVQELTTYRVPDDLRDVLQILSAVLIGDGAQA